MLRKFSCIALILGFPLHALAQGNDFYISGFGGGGFSDYNGMAQTGTAFFPPVRGGALQVHATNDAQNKPAWFVGLNAGYQLGGWALCVGCSPWCLSPAAELEGYYLSSRIHGDELNNPTSRLPEHLFHDSFDINMGVLLANTVWTFKIPCSIVEPYIGGGVGAAIVSLYNADSLQLSPAEPGVNHFNSNTSDSDWTFAAQAKAGLRFQLTKNVKLFAEYRYLYLSPTSYRFGSTVYSFHVPTSKWGVRFDSMSYNLGNIGIEYNFDMC